MNVAFSWNLNIFPWNVNHVIAFWIFLNLENVNVSVDVDKRMMTFCVVNKIWIWIDDVVYLMTFSKGVVKAYVILMTMSLANNIDVSFWEKDLIHVHVV